MVYCSPRTAYSLMRATACDSSARGRRAGLEADGASVHHLRCTPGAPTASRSACRISHRRATRVILRRWRALAYGCATCPTRSTRCGCALWRGARSVPRRPPVSPGVARLAAQGRRVVLLIWEKASRYISYEVRTWLRQHKHKVKQTGRGQGHAVFRTRSCQSFPSPSTGEGEGGGEGWWRTQAMLLPPIPTFPRQGGRG